MSWRLVAALMAGIALCGCGGNPIGAGGDGDGDGDGDLSDIPEALRGNLDSVSYDEDDGTLTVVIDTLDASPTRATFTRDATLDTGDFRAFTYQETTTNRIFLALLNTSEDGAATAGVTGSGQFTEMVWGSNYKAETAFTRPSGGGLASYTGSYAGVLNSGVRVPGPGAPFDPIRPARTTGDVLVNADFTNGRVEGGITNRSIVETGDELDDVFLQITSIESNGTFGGTVVFRDLNSAGTYGGTFAGRGGSAVAGAIEIAPDRSSSDLLERGAFALDRCGSGDPAPCP